MNRRLSVNVLILHENFDAAIMARVTLEPFLDLLKRDFAVRLDLWGLDELQAFPLLREDSAAEALAADIIVVALHDGVEILEVLREWFGVWVPKKKGRPSALVVLSRNGERTCGKGTPLEAYFREVAASGGMELFCPAAPPLDLERFMPTLRGRVHMA